MYSVKISNIKKIYPGFKPSNIDIIRLAQKIQNLGNCDMIIMTDGRMLVVTADEITLFASEYGYLAIEEELMAHVKCHTVQYKNDYCFCIDEDSAGKGKWLELDALKAGEPNEG